MTFVASRGVIDLNMPGARDLKAKMHQLSIRRNTQGARGLDTDGMPLPEKDVKPRGVYEARLAQLESTRP